MNDFDEAAQEGPPVPSNYEDLLLEYYNLRGQLRRTNEKWANLVMKKEQDRRSAAGMLAQMREEIADLREQIEILKNCPTARGQ